MFNTIKNKTKYFLFNFFARKKHKLEHYMAWDSIQPSFSQFGEDRVLGYCLDEAKCNYDDGFYVDIGGFHPHFLNNTYLLYSRGWRGINVDADAEAIVLFDKYRPRDINLNAAVLNEEKIVTFHKFKDLGPCSSIDDKQAEGVV